MFANANDEVIINKLRLEQHVHAWLTLLLPSNIFKCISEQQVISYIAWSQFGDVCQLLENV